MSSFGSRTVAPNVKDLNFRSDFNSIQPFLSIFTFGLQNIVIQIYIVQSAQRAPPCSLVRRDPQNCVLKRKKKTVHFISLSFFCFVLFL